jgi:hypothetical protein
MIESKAAYLHKDFSRLLIPYIEAPLLRYLSLIILQMVAEGPKFKKPPAAFMKIIL